jgi:excinuclease ABC subunit C
MVVAEEGKITKKEYKRFKIKYKKTPDDFEMIYEVISRRSNHRDDWPKPDLLLIDGGKGQVSSAMAAVDHNGWDATVAGLAKREETIVYREGLDFIEVKLDKNDVGLKLLIRLRDEAHRFAQAYHHKLRAKALLPKD